MRTLSPVSVAAEIDTLIATLRACGGNVAKAARELNVSRATLWRRIVDYGIKPDDYRVTTAP
jgi:transcriptional regulator of acetoin/glycerol metabolism